MTWQLAIAWIAILLFAAGSFFFAVAETALFSLGSAQTLRLIRGSGNTDGLLSGLLSKPQDVLATIVLGNTLCNAAIVALGLWSQFRLDWPLGYTLAALAILILGGCEVLPKTLAVRAPIPWALWIARPMAWLQRLSAPLKRMAQFLNHLILKTLSLDQSRNPNILTDEEYQELVEMAYQTGALARSEKEIISQIIRLDRRTVKEVMRPRTQMACIPDDLPVEEMIAAARRYKHRRLPMYDETPDTIVGILNTRVLLLEPQVDLSEAIEFPSFVPESMNLLQLLKSLQRQQRGLAIVLDEFGGTSGLVTTEDILEEMIGEIRSEGEEAGFLMETMGDGRWRVNAAVRIDDFRRECPELGTVPEVETLGGLILTRLEMVPAKGQTMNFRGLRFTVTSADERRVRELLVERTRKKGGGA